MAVTLTTNVGMSFGSQSFGPYSVSIASAGQLIIVSETILASTADQLVALALDVSQIKAFGIYSAQSLTLETNHITAVGGQTIALVAGIPQFWQISSLPAVCPITPDVTSLYVTKADASTTELVMWFLVDPVV